MHPTDRLQRAVGAGPTIPSHNPWPGCAPAPLQLVDIVPPGWLGPVPPTDGRASGPACYPPAPPATVTDRLEAGSETIPLECSPLAWLPEPDAFSCTKPFSQVKL